MTATSAAAASETIEIIRTLDRLQEVGSSWRELCADAGASVFQSHEWISAWSSALTDWTRRELCIVVAWHGDALQAILPLAVHKKWGLRVLEWTAREYSDYCDALVRPGAELSLLARMWVHLESTCGFDFALLTHVRPEAAVQALRDAPGLLRAYHRSATSSQLVIDAPSGEAWFDAHPKKFRQNYKRGKTLMGEGASVNFRLLSLDEPLTPALERLAALKRMWLARNGIAAPLFDEGNKMLPALVGAIAREGALRIFVIECDAKIIAISVNFEHRGALMAYLTSYDPEYARASPGMSLMIDYIKWALDRGMKTVDFLCGDEAFKGRLANQTIKLGSLCRARTLLGRAALMVDALYERMRAKARTPAKSTGSVNGAEA